MIAYMVEIKCKICKKKFRTQPSRKQKYCSYFCAGKSRTGKNNNKWKGGPIILKCETCKKVFEVCKAKIKRGKKYCSKQCYSEYQKTLTGKKSNGWKGKLKLNCNQCGNSFLTYQYRKETIKYCSRKCYAKFQETIVGEKHFQWRGGKYKTGGYIYVYKPDHPQAKRNKRHYVAEHRLVMEEHLGRYLESYEVIHHKNGVRDDNRLENLQLMTKREHDKHHCIKNEVWEYAHA